MPKARRIVVSGHTAEGKSVIVSDRQTVGTPVLGREGRELTQVWGADETLQFPDAGARPKYSALYPPLNGFRVMELFMDANTADVTSGPPKTYFTASVDVLIIVEGSCILTLSEDQVTMHAGDVLIQNGTLHGWSNPFATPCRFIAILMGAKHKHA